MTGRQWITSSWVFVLWWASLLIMTDCAEVNQCVDPRSPKNYLPLSCPQQELLFIKKVLIAKTASTVAENFCANPYHIEACEQNIEILTEAGRRVCNTVSRCDMPIPVPPTDTCGPNYTGKTYIHAEYSCLSREVVNDHGSAAQSDCDSLRREEMSTKSFLYSSNYPGGWQSGSHCSCTLQLRHQIFATIRVLELTHNSSLNSPACPFFLHMSLRGQNWTVCALKAGIFNPPERIGPYLMAQDSVEFLKIEFKTEASNIGGRFWLEISAVHKEHGPVPAMLSCQPKTTPSWPSTTRFTTRPQDGATSGELIPEWTTPSNLSASYNSPPQPQTLKPDLRIIIGGAIAGAAVVLLLVILLAVCIERRRRRVKKERDLAYICHANVAVASKLGGNKLGSLRHPPMGVKHLSLQLLDQPPLATAPHHSGARPSGKKKPHTYKNVIVSPDTQQSMESLPPYSTSLTTLTPHAEDSSRRKPHKGMPTQSYDDSDVFASFPRWANIPKNDHSRGETMASDRGSYTQTLPSKFKAATAVLRSKDFRPKPLPKPKRSGNCTLGSSTQSIVHDSSMDIYAKPQKGRKRGITIVENDFYRT